MNTPGWREARRPEDQTDERGSWEAGRGEGSQSSRQGQAVRGLENRIKSLRFHPKPKGTFQRI